MKKILFVFMVTILASGCKKCLTCKSQNPATAAFVGDQEICAGDSRYIPASKGESVFDGHGSYMDCY